MRISKWQIVSSILIIQGIIYSILLFHYGFDEQSNRICIRLTARLAGILFALAFSASALVYLTKN